MNFNKLVSLLFSLIFILSSCQNNDLGEASVQKVSFIIASNSIGLKSKYSGVVSTQKETKIEKSTNQSVKDILVEVGDIVNEGDVLFTYDQEQLNMDLTKAQLELDKMNNTITSKTAEIKRLEEDKEEASSADILEYNLDIRELETDIIELKYNLKLKEQELKKLKDSLVNDKVSSPINGRIKEINNATNTTSEDPSKFIVITENGNYRIKGFINETNASALTIGNEVTIRSRIDDKTWKGVISSIDFENPENSNNGNEYYGMRSSDDTKQSSSYPFYVELDNIDGLMLGQHVYIEPFMENTIKKNAIYLNEWYICDIDSKPYVYAQSEKGKLEKREVILGEYDEMNSSYEIVSGITMKDYIALPDETLQVGMKCLVYDEDSFADSIEAERNIG